MKKIQVITLFPEMFPGVFGASMLFKAQKNSVASLETVDLRQFGLGPRKQVDDTPYGGGDGMLLMIEPLFEAIKFAKEKDPTAKVVLMSPRGQRWRQSMVRDNAGDDDGIIIVCGRYEGVDERVLEFVDEQWSVGDFVLTGGELPAMTMIDSIIRLMPGVLGGEKSAEIESFSEENVLEYPQYTRPENFNGSIVPEVLLSGHHANIDIWRNEQSERISKEVNQQR